MTNYESFFARAEGPKISSACKWLEDRTRTVMENISHGDFGRWKGALYGLPEIVPSVIELCDGVRIGKADDCGESVRGQITDCLRHFHPWRKGPFELFGIEIDTEWRSDWKWDRVKNVIAPLDGKCVLDIGCGNGYHCMRMAGAGAGAVVGIDPFLLYVMQFHAVNKYAGLENVSVLPLGVEDLPDGRCCFDSVFSMGVVYHRRDPVAHLRQIYNLLAGGGQAIVESLVIDVEGESVLKPAGRYAKMRNVFAIPSVESFKGWMKVAGFEDVRVVDVTKTSFDEQRKTEWMSFESLEDFLDPADASRTVEGYPSPVRAVCVGRK